MAKYLMNLILKAFREFLPCFCLFVEPHSDVVRAHSWLWAQEFLLTMSRGLYMRWVEPVTCKASTSTFSSTLSSLQPLVVALLNPTNNKKNQSLIASRVLRADLAWLPLWARLLAGPIASCSGLWHLWHMPVGEKNPITLTPSLLQNPEP